MKRYPSTRVLICLPVLLFFSGCLEEQVRTIISADGSSERVISMKLPSRELPDKAFPVARNSTWSTDWKKLEEKDNKFEYIARKIFRTPDELHREYADLPDTGGIRIDVTVGRRFGWFFTYIDYQEVYT